MGILSLLRSVDPPLVTSRVGAQFGGGGGVSPVFIALAQEASDSLARISFAKIHLVHKLLD